MTTKDDTESIVIQSFWEEHIEKSQEDYDPYHYIPDLNITGEDILMDFDWEEEE